MLQIKIVGIERGLRLPAGYHVSRTHVTFGRLSGQPV